MQFLPEATQKLLESLDSKLYYSMGVLFCGENGLQPFFFSSLFQMKRKGLCSTLFCMVATRYRVLLRLPDI